MREFCLTEETIQRFVDGELSSDEMERAAAHLSGCDDCARLLGEVEEQSALLMEAFAPEMSLPVPTERLRERLDVAIAELSPRPVVASESAGSRVRNWFGSLFGSFSLTPQQSLGFASLAVVIAFAAIFAVIQLRSGKETVPTIAGNNPQAQPSSQPQPPQATTTGGGNENPGEGAAAAAPGASPSATVQTVAQTNNRQRPKSSAVKQPGQTVTNGSQAPDGMQPATVGPRLLPGEQGYLEAIASLTTAIEANKDDVLKPTVRADYERNLAVVDQAIATTRQQAKRNPNDRDAVEFMYMAYQNKIELLSAVADQTRLASR